jgi:hypothetical protein
MASAIVKWIMKEERNQWKKAACENENISNTKLSAILGLAGEEMSDEMKRSWNEEKWKANQWRRKYYISKASEMQWLEEMTWSRNLIVKKQSSKGWEI